jgi:hypothetical protein
MLTGDERRLFAEYPPRVSEVKSFNIGDVIFYQPLS